MRSWLLVLVVACGGGAGSAPPPNPPTPKPEPVAIAPAGPPQCPAPLTAPCMVTVMDYYATEMCKCTAKACVEKVNNDLVKWAEDAAKAATDVDKPTDADAQRMGQIMTRYGDCMTKVMMAEGGSNYDDPPPPEEEDNPCGD